MIRSRGSQGHAHEIDPCYGKVLLDVWKRVTDRRLVAGLLEHELEKIIRERDRIVLTASTRGGGRRGD